MRSGVFTSRGGCLVCHAERSEASKLLTNQALEDSLNAPLPFRAAKHPPVRSRAAQVPPQQFDGASLDSQNDKYGRHCGVTEAGRWWLRGGRSAAMPLRHGRAGFQMLRVGA
ncbi:MAG: hypothetical protein D0433_08760 [Candidatus Thermochlorobacter aerophilum]|uniref:Uncharacterized protein n=1 Tax=Candidatus Thermochlorobacter aerophilus TaxID=1868324 RepID=A0A395LZC8_9BACT|nr:MAG: hypothetical protein D0433_08760 [Candidatus Thermochlorobacter aerophilum]